MGLASAAALGGGLACGRADPKTPLAYAFGDAAGDPSGAELAPTPACEDDRRPTAAAIEGPFYLPGTPRRTRLAGPETPGERLALIGRVLDRRCRPVAGAVLDFWQADAAGRYDRDGMGLRGHQFADAEGRFALESVVPGAYAAGWSRRTPHLHVKVQGRDTALLTTQLYFPDAAEHNRRDGLYDPALRMAELENLAAGTRVLRFDFVLDDPATA